MAESIIFIAESKDDSEEFIMKVKLMSNAKWPRTSQPACLMIIPTLGLEIINN